MLFIEKKNIPTYHKNIKKLVIVQKNLQNKCTLSSIIWFCTLTFLQNISLLIFYIYHNSTKHTSLHWRHDALETTTRRNFNEGNFWQPQSLTPPDSECGCLRCKRTPKTVAWFRRAAKTLLASDTDTLPWSGMFAIKTLTHPFTPFWPVLCIVAMVRHRSVTCIQVCNFQSGQSCGRNFTRYVLLGGFSVILWKSPCTRSVR